MSRTGDGGPHIAFVVALHNDAVLHKLLLDKNHLLCAFDDKVPAWINGTLSDFRQLGRRLVGKHAFGAAKHNRHAPNADRFHGSDELSATRVLNVDVDGGRVRLIAKTALLLCKGEDMKR